MIVPWVATRRRPGLRPARIAPLTWGYVRSRAAGTELFAWTILPHAPGRVGVDKYRDQRKRRNETILSDWCWQTLVAPVEPQCSDQGILSDGVAVAGAVRVAPRRRAANVAHGKGAGPDTCRAILKRVPGALSGRRSALPQEQVVTVDSGRPGPDRAARGHLAARCQSRPPRRPRSVPVVARPGGCQAAGGRCGVPPGPCSLRPAPGVSRRFRPCPERALSSRYRPGGVACRGLRPREPRWGCRGRRRRWWCRVGGVATEHRPEPVRGARGHRRRRSPCTAATGKVGWKSPDSSRARATRAYAHIALRPARRGFPLWKFPRRKQAGTSVVAARRQREESGSAVTAAIGADWHPESEAPARSDCPVGTRSVGVVAAATVAAARPSGCVDARLPLAPSARGRGQAARPGPRPGLGGYRLGVRLGRPGHGAPVRGAADRAAVGVFPGEISPSAAARGRSQRDVRVGARRARTRGAPGISFGRDRRGEVPATFVGSCDVRIPARPLYALGACPVTAGRAPVLSRWGRGARHEKARRESWWATDTPDQKSGAPV